MGPKISVDSATLMNKGLEVIEAHHLFGVPRRRASTCWCIRRAWCIRWSSSSTARTLAQLGLPDMRTALAVGLALAGAHRLGRRPGSTCCSTAASISRRPTCDAFPCLRPRLRGAARRRHRAGGAQRGQRSRGFSLSSGPDRLSWRFPRWSSDTLAALPADAGRHRWTTLREADARRARRTRAGRRPTHVRDGRRA